MPWKKQWRREPTEWEKMYTLTELVLRIYKELRKEERKKKRERMRERRKKGVTLAHDFSPITQEAEVGEVDL